MGRRRIRSCAQLRAATVATSTATLAAAAHAAAGGGLPSGAGAVQLTVAGLTLGAVAAVTRHGDRFATLAALLAVGQAVGHVLLGSHHHGSAGSTSAAVMVSAHVVAVVAVAGLIAIGDALCRAVSRAITAATPRPRCPVRAPAAPMLRRCEHPMRASLLLAASWSYRGPPVGVAR